ncbi:MHYT domain-containing protein [Promicromonospora sukumoe]|uniref:MHYT domain-containing protein n=1 Tax=Promicromonospora sukumoe TaxID=88382 RepID=UPI0036654916
MPAIDHFTFGFLTPVLAYAISCTGAATGLACTSRARAATAGARAVWLVLGAIALGGTGIWVMHFVAMLGFSASGVEIRYDIPQTLLSAAVAIVMVGAGLFITELGKRKLPALMFGGVLAGVGVAAMHYMGMAAMEMSAQIAYDFTYVAASVAIAVVAATAALWCTVHIRGTLATIVATLVMGVAVTGMHYTGMAGVSVVNPVDSVPAGASTMQLLVPLVMAVSIVTFLLILGIGLWPTEDELREQIALEARLKDQEQGVGQSSGVGATSSLASSS